MQLHRNPRSSNNTVYCDKVFKQGKEDEEVEYFYFIDEIPQSSISP